MTTEHQRRVAIVGAGVAGSACAQALTRAGHRVQVFDKSRGPGGRLATRRQHWVDDAGQACTTRLDHGAPGFAARSPAFQAFVGEARAAGVVANWLPALAPGSLPLDGGAALHVPLPDMPALCRRLLDGVASRWSVTVDQLEHGPHGWQIAAGGVRQDGVFDAIVLALPPAQAAALLSPHRSDWARQAALVPMQPCWTLMGVAAESAGDDAADPATAWDLARPPSGPLGWVMRSDARPGRERVPGEAHWVVHARPGWSRQHLEQPPAWVEQQLREALDDWLGQPVAWRHATVHRWRYAQPPAQAGEPAAVAWWDGTRGLGVCGDFLGGAGVEGAWLSARSLATAMGAGVAAEAACLEPSR